MRRRDFTVALAAGTVAVLSHPSVAGGLLLTALKARKPAPDFALEDLDGEITRLSTFRGKVVIVNFWATWCPPCRFEIPSMQRAWNILREEDVVMLAVHVGGDADRVFQFTADYDVEFPVVLDIESVVIDEWPVRGLPTTIIVDGAGNMVLRAVGGREWDDPAILDQIRSLKT